MNKYNFKEKVFCVIIDRKPPTVSWGYVRAMRLVKVGETKAKYLKTDLVQYQLDGHDAPINCSNMSFPEHFLFKNEDEAKKYIQENY